MAETLSEQTQEMIKWLRDLIDNQSGGDAVILVQRQRLNKVVGQLVKLDRLLLKDGSNG